MIDKLIQEQITLQQKSTAHMLGRAAALSHQPFLRNPYDRATDLWEAWRIGYLAQLDDERDMLRAKQVCLKTTPG